MQVSKWIMTGALTLSLSALPALAEDGSVPMAYPDRQAFFAALIETLPGRWDAQWADGLYENPTSEWRPTRVDYYVTSGGTALVENYLGSDDNVYMTTVYHLDNNDIRATHYCGAKNHPSMISRGFNADTGTLTLGFVDVSNLESPDSYHSRDIELSLVDENNVHVTFFGLEEGEENSRVFALKRASK